MNCGCLIIFHVWNLYFRISPKMHRPYFTPSEKGIEEIVPP
jgi:hypothetical protein